MLPTLFESEKERISKHHEILLNLPNKKLLSTNGIYHRYQNPVITKDHIPLKWRFDFNPDTNPFFLERISFNSTFNAGALLWNNRFLLFVRVEGVDRKSFFAIAESNNGIDNFRFWDEPIHFPNLDEDETNVYDIRITQHEDGWIYGLFCSEHLDPNASNGDLSSAIANTGIIRSKDLIHWERLPNVVAKSQQRNIVLHPEFINGQYALYTRPQDSFILAESGGGIGWTLLGDISKPIILNEEIINRRNYHTIKELKNGEGPPAIKTDMGWLHLAHGVRGTAAGFRYVLYLYVTSLSDPSKIIAEPGGYFMAPDGDERVGDVSNVLFSNGWIVQEDGAVFIYYASSDTRMHVAVSSVELLLDYCFNTKPDNFSSKKSLENVLKLIQNNVNFY